MCHCHRLVLQRCAIVIGWYCSVVQLSSVGTAALCNCHRLVLQRCAIVIGWELNMMGLTSIDRVHDAWMQLCLAFTLNADGYRLLLSLLKATQTSTQQKSATSSTRMRACDVSDGVFYRWRFLFPRKKLYREDCVPGD
ncbi:hypothetical protein LOAG_06003 [Loa loa]|uniref:Secreted protein n=1 Tax=Loa loa TaxID=7209 RepID=A0A1S0TYJ7_LOALO|nr:hypothetical protein LOAG_06003 [Loa loa]EFO22482.1 hypothetical protein LOAG_06003 [Loa loa]